MATTGEGDASGGSVTTTGEGEASGGGDNGSDQPVRRRKKGKNKHGKKMRLGRTAYENERRG